MPQTVRTRIAKVVSDNLRSTDPEWPDLYTLSPRLLAYWEKSYPPRCMKTDESQRDHDRYAGVVEFLATIRAQVDRIADFSEGEDEDDIIMAEVDRAMGRND